jgi:SNF2 family DNA or RNA helicase
MEPELLAKVHSVAYRATKAECLDLPETTDVIRYVDLSGDAARLYREVSRECYAELATDPSRDGSEISATNILTKILRLSQITGGFVTNDDGDTVNVSKDKLRALEEIIEGIRQEGKKLVVIAKFTAEIDAIKRMLKQSGIEYAAVSGETKDRAAEVKAFQENPNVAVFIGQIACASLGLTLTAASDLAFYSYDYSTANHEQARARIHRSGQTAPCTYYYIQARNTIDEKIRAALTEKANLARVLIDDFRNNKNPFGEEE